jgi:hypothetical protein
MRALRLFIPIFCLVAILAFSQEHQHNPATTHPSAPSADQQHQADVNTHGDMAMGFSHLKTTHHFSLTKSGGAISVEANDPKDLTSLDQIRMHLQHISHAFKLGDFSAPEMTHSRVPPGVGVMQRKKSEIDYRFIRTKLGGKVVIATKSPEALEAIHRFLKFQIEDHRTGDPLTVRPN